MMERPDKKTLTSAEFKEVYPEKYKWVDSHPLITNSDGYKGIFICCEDCGRGFFRRNGHQYRDNSRDGVIRCNSCRGRVGRSKECGVLGKDGLLAASKKRSETMGPEGLSKAAKKIADNCKTNNKGWFSVEANDKRVSTMNRLREERGGSWATQSEWEQQIAKEFGGTCGVCVSWKGSRGLYPDIVFPDGHVIQIDDAKHKAVKGLTKNNWDTGEKKPTYEWEYDQAMISTYGKRPLHIVLPQYATLRRERFKTWRDLVTAYLNDELNEDEYILTAEPVYGDMLYGI